MEKEQKIKLVRILFTVAALIALHFVHVTGTLRLILYIAVYLVIGYDILWEAIEGIREKELFDEDFLMAGATIGAFALAIYEKTGSYNEAIAVMLFFQIGEFFEDYAVDRSRDNIAGLMDIRPDYANVEENGKLSRVSPDTVPIGTVIVVQPGEKIPIDGVVTGGTSTLNTAALTGESLPRSVEAGDAVVSGSVNQTGLLKIRTTKAFGESTVSQILELVEDAAERKSKSEAFITRFARFYTPIVCISALLLAVLPPVIRMTLLHTAPRWHEWIYRALTFLVISCPCALVVSIPLTFFAGIGGASRAGILIKGSNFMETLSKTKTVVFDKTGTLTKGVFEVDDIHHSEMEHERLLEYAALAESASSHPISASLQRAYGKEIDRTRVTEIHEDSGRGVTAKVDGVPVAAGNEKLMESLGVSYIPCRSAGTIIHVAINGEYQGHIVVSDVIKPQSAEAMTELRRAGVTKTVMLTGDSWKVAERVAQTLKLNEAHAGLLPEQKVEQVERLLQQQQGKGTLTFVGDGVNDAPVLTRADLGIAMGAMGSDAAIEAADVVLMDDNPTKVAKAIRIARKCLRIVYQNIAFAIAVKLACLILGALGFANMWLAVFADVGVMVLAVLNAIRALRVKNL